MGYQPERRRGVLWAREQADESVTLIRALVLQLGNSVLDAVDDQPVWYEGAWHRVIDLRMPVHGYVY